MRDHIVYTKILNLIKIYNINLISIVKLFLLNINKYYHICCEIVQNFMILK